MHYSDKINSVMIDSIRDHENQICTTNLDNYLLRSEEFVKKFDLEKVKSELSSCMN